MATRSPSPQRATARLRIRQAAPATSALKVGYIEVGTVFTPLAVVEGESVMGNAAWFALSENRFVWSGASAAVNDVAPVTPPNGMRVHRRPDGSIKVLSPAEREAVFGSFSFTEVQPTGAVKIDRAWTRENIVEIETPILAHVGYQKISVHRKAAAPFQRVLAKLDAAALQDRIKTCAGDLGCAPYGMGSGPPAQQPQLGSRNRPERSLERLWSPAGVARGDGIGSRARPDL